MNKPLRCRIWPFITLFLCCLILPSYPATAGERAQQTINDSLITLLRAQEETAFHLGVSAYIWGYSLVGTERLQRDRILQASPGVPQAALNQFGHVRELRDADYKKIATPNNDTIYSHAYLDLRKEPIVVTVPEVKDRYYVLPLLSAYQEVFGSIGTRETMGDAGSYAIVGPGWEGQLPDNIHRIDSPSNMVIVWGRVAVNGSNDLKNARAVQDSFVLTPLSSYTENPTTPQPDWEASENRANLTLWTPKSGVPESLSFFYELGEAMKLTPLRPEDTAVVEQFQAIGLTTKKGFDIERLSNATIIGLSRAIAAAELMIDGSANSDGQLVNGWFFNNRTGIFGNDYLFRAAIAKWYAGANKPEEAMYYVAKTGNDGKPFNGASAYSIHFETPPPARAFWSLSMYNAFDGSLVKNSISRYSIGDRTEGLLTNPDNSIDIQIQQHEPSQSTNNWLPAPSAGFYLVLRLYMPESEVVSGQWAPPQVSITAE